MKDSSRYLAVILLGLVTLMPAPGALCAEVDGSAKETAQLKAQLDFCKSQLKKKAESLAPLKAEIQRLKAKLKTLEADNKRLRGELTALLGLGKEKARPVRVIMYVQARPVWFGTPFQLRELFETEREANPVAAKDKYKDAAFIVSGPVKAVRELQGKPLITVGEGAHEVSFKMLASQREATKKLRKGAPVTIKARWSPAAPGKGFQRGEFLFPRLLARTPAKREAPPVGITVYVTKRGEKYHRKDCQFVKGGGIPIKLKDAKARGYEPCGVCKPPE